MEQENWRTKNGDIKRKTEPGSVLNTRRLLKIYNKVPVVNRIDLTFHTGQIIGLLGRNGAGKTTTFLMLAGIVKPDGGEITLDDKAINHLPSFKRAEKGLIYLPQEHSVFLKTTVFENLLLILQIYYNEKTARARSEDLIEDFGLGHVRYSKAFTLSGGEKRRLEIARAMIMKPKFLFLDEPFTGIDPITIIDIQTTIIKLKERGIGIIITDHNVRDTFNITDRVYILHIGEILSNGKPDVVVREPQTRNLFLGDDFNWRQSGNTINNAG